MTDGLTAGLEITGAAAVRKASSSCCGAKLNGSPQQWECRACGRPCERVLGGPEEVIVSG